MFNWFLKEKPIFTGLKFGFGGGGGSVPTPFSVEYLVAAGGGGGGRITSSYTSGGGAGGLLTNSSFGVSTLVDYPIVIGSGGAYGNPGTNGNNSIFHNITAVGGGGGAINPSPTPTAGNPGGSGGGGAQGGSGGTGVPGQGNPGGGSLNGTGSGGGGGGAASAGTSSGNNFTAGNGGAGLQSSITGTSVYYSAGGAGYAPALPDFGSPGTGWVASSNTGHGGRADGNGQSGVIILKIPERYSAIFSPGVGSNLSLSVPGYKIYTITSTSTILETVKFT